MPEPKFTEKQGQYLAFIHAYSTIHGYPPAIFDFQRFFGVSGASAQTMVARLTDLRLIKRTAGAPRSIELLVEPELLPVLRRP